jgi:hypothetical protein
MRQVIIAVGIDSNGDEPMPAGRCAGCGLIESMRKIQIHTLTCEPYLRLYQSDPHSCPDPAAELARYRVRSNTFESRALARDQRLSSRFAALDRHQTRQAARWATPPDLLAD